MNQHELKRLKAELLEEEYKRLKGSLWAFRKKPEDLKPEEHQVPERLFTLAPKLELAHNLRQQLTALFEQPLSKQAAQIKIQALDRTGQEKRLEVL